MALTYRTGSGGKGSALTIEELDNNFRYFTGSHSVTGSFEVSGSIVLTGSLDIEGSITGPLDVNGAITSSGDISTNANISGANLTVSGSLNLIGGIDSTLRASDGLQEIELSVVDANNGNNPDNFKILLDNQGDGYFMAKTLVLGDEEGVYGNTKLTIDAQEEWFLFEDGDVGIGTSTPTSKLQVVGLAEHADNAAALVAGLTIGAFYRTGDLLKVVH